MITREKVLERMEALNRQLDQHLSNANACKGAIQDCEFWLAQLPEKAQLKAVPLQAEPEEVEARAT